MNESYRISLEDAVYELDRVRTALEDILQEDLIQPLNAIYEVLSDMYEYHIYTFDCTDPRVNDLYYVRRVDSPDYQTWADSMSDFIKDNTITLGGNHHEIER